jgi:NADH:ubiquinone oxidoreductase subunit 6 (subunit J)
VRRLILIVFLGAISVVFWRIFRVDNQTFQPRKKAGTRWWVLLLLILLTPFILIGLFFLMAAFGYAPGPD